MALKPKTRALILIAGSLLTVILAVTVVIISLRLQNQGSRSVTPTTPESRPSADVTASCALTFTVGTVVPPPTNLKAVCSTDGKQVVLSWGAVSGADHYEIGVDYIDNNTASCDGAWYCADPPDKRELNYKSNSLTVTTIPDKPYAFWMYTSDGTKLSEKATVPNFSCPSIPLDAGFFIQKFNDKNNNKSRDSGEDGLDWDFEWELNSDNNFRTYQTYADKNGEGGRIGELKDGDKVHIREKSKGGWSATNGTEQTFTVKLGETYVAFFGNRQPTTVGCNNSCSADTDCASGLFCSKATGATSGVCRNNACVNKTNCTCDVVTTTTTPTTIVKTPPTAAPIAEAPLPEAGSTGQSILLFLGGTTMTVLGVIGLLAL